MEKGWKRGTHKVKNLGPVICPKCGSKGGLQGHLWRDRKTGNICGPYFYIQHGSHRTMKKVASTLEHTIIRVSKEPFKYCYFGKLSVTELDTLLKARPWPLNAEDAMTLLHHEV